MTEKVVIGNATLYQGDCLEILPTLGQVDAVITDPPYGISHVTNHGASWAGRKILGDSDTTARDAVLTWAGDRPWAAFGGYKSPTPSGFKYKIIWDKGPAFGAGDLTFPWKQSFEECWIAGSGWRSSSRGEGVWRGPCVVSWESVANGRVHPHQKPAWIFEKLISALPDVMMVCDPFMGSGTTGIACANLGRSFIGIELDPRYFDIACERIERAQAQGQLFAPEIAPLPVQGRINFLESGATLQ